MTTNLFNTRYIDGLMITLVTCSTEKELNRIKEETERASITPAQRELAQKMVAVCLESIWRGQGPIEDFQTLTNAVRCR